MSTLVLTVLFGIAFAYFAAGNSGGVNVNFGGYFLNMPLYAVALTSLLLGVALSWVISLLNGIFSFFSGYKKDARIRELEEENAKLIAKKESEKTVVMQERTNEPSLRSKIRSRLSF